MSQTLWNLIQCLTKNEKRYFKLLAKSFGKSNANYLQLYEALAAMPVYEEKDLLFRLRKKQWLAQLPAYRSYLHKLLIKSLHLQHLEESVEGELLLGLGELKILYQKQRFDLCRQRLQELQAKAQQFDKAFYLPRLLEWEMVLENSVFFFKDWEAADLQAKTAAYRQSLLDLQAYMTVRSQALALFFVSRKKNQTRLLQTDALFLSVADYFMNTPPPATMSAFVAYQQAKAFAYSTYENDAETFREWAILVEYLQGIPQVIDDSDLLRTYCGALISALGFAVSLRDKSSTDHYLGMLDALLENDRLPIWAVAQRKHLGILVCILTGDFEAAMVQVPALEVWLTSPAADQSPHLLRLLLPFEIAMTYFAHRQWDKAQVFLEQVLAAPPAAAPMLYNSARMLRLIMYYEQQEFLLIESAIRSFRRSLDKQQAFFEFERLWVLFLKKAIQTADKDKQQKHLLKLEKELLRLANTTDAAQREPFKYFNYIAWVRSAISQKPFLETAKLYADQM